MADRETGLTGPDHDHVVAGHPPATLTAIGIFVPSTGTKMPLDRDQAVLTSSGISTSRLRILPVGPFGSSSGNQILRGYL
jgi:hypothetical protein